MNTYWENKGKYQEDYNRLLTLMPGYGKADTVAGELIRAASKLSYEFYNNGMCNNVSGALNFLNQNSVFCNSMRIYDTIKPYTTGESTYRGNYKGCALMLAIEQMMDLTLLYIASNPALETMQNHTDMLDLDEECYEEEYRDEECYEEE